jgi:hypothetical protein
MQQCDHPDGRAGADEEEKIANGIDVP